MEKQRGKVPSKLPAFPAALLYLSLFAAKRFKRRQSTMRFASSSAAVEET